MTTISSIDSSSPFHAPDAHPADVLQNKNATNRKFLTVHHQILHDKRSSTITLHEHRELQKKMRKRTDSSSRDLLSQALKVRHNHEKSSGLLSVLQKAKNQLKSTAGSHNDLIHTVDSFDQALKQTGSALKVFVMVGFKIKQVLRIDHVHLTFYANFNLFVQWNDPRLINVNPTNIRWDDSSFDPKLEIVNGTDIETYQNVKILVEPSTGLVKQTLSMRGNLTIHETSFGAFPYDYQDLRIQIKSFKYPGHSVLLVCQGTSMIEHHPREEWVLSGLRTEVYTTNPHASAMGNSYSTMHIVIMVERDPTCMCFFFYSVSICFNSFYFAGLYIFLILALI